MAEIYRARATGIEGFEKILVVKKILPVYAKNKAFIDMLIAEAKVSALLQHGNVVQIFDLGDIEGQYFIVMEYVHGCDLLRLLSACTQSKRKIPTELVLYIVSEAAKGLAYAHSATNAQGRPLNIIHRDVSPSNILVSYEGDVKVTDFGVARADLETSGPRKAQKNTALKGKLGYMSPELVTGDDIDARSDIFALGIILWETLTLRRLFLGKTDIQTLINIRDVRIEKKFKKHSYIPEGIQDLIRRALTKDRRERFQTATDFQEAILDYLFENRIRVTARSLAQFVREMVPEERASPGVSRLVPVAKDEAASPGAERPGEDTPDAHDAEAAAEAARQAPPEPEPDVQAAEGTTPDGPELDEEPTGVDAAPITDTGDDRTPVEGPPVIEERAGTEPEALQAAQETLSEAEPEAEPGPEPEPEPQPEAASEGAPEAEAPPEPEAEPAPVLEAEPPEPEPEVEAAPEPDADAAPEPAREPEPATIEEAPRRAEELDEGPIHDTLDDIELDPEDLLAETADEPPKPAAPEPAPEPVEEAPSVEATQEEVPAPKPRSKVSEDKPTEAQAALAHSTFRVKGDDAATFGPITFNNLKLLIKSRSITAQELVSIDGQPYVTIAESDLPKMEPDLFEEEPEQPLYEGPISQIRTPQLLYELAIARVVGKLKLTRGTVLKEIYFQGGVPVHINSNLKHELLANFMLERKLIREGELRQALDWIKEHGGRLGDALVSQGLLKPHDLYRVVELQFRQRFLEIFRWERGWYEFLEGYGPPSDIVPLGDDAIQLLTIGIRTQYDLSVMRAIFADYLDQVIVIQQNHYITHNNLRFNSRELRFYTYLETGMTLRETLAAFGRSEEDEITILQVIFTLHQTDLLSFRSPASQVGRPA